MKKHNSRAPVVRDPDTSEQNRLGLERLILFSDAVFAIAITVLVLDIHLPAAGETADNGQLLLILTGLWPKYLAYIISFGVIGFYWLSHHRKFLLIQRFDNRLLRLNLLLLMVIAFIPFPTSVLSENGNRTATIFYALIMASGGLLIFLLWWYATRNHRLVDAHLSKQLFWQEAASPLATAAVFIISIAIAFWNEGFVVLFWIFLLPLSLVINTRRTAA